MIKVSIFYPYSEDKKFDMEYYCNKHMVLAKQKFGAACKGVLVERGLSGGFQGESPTYVVMGHLLFDSLEDFQSMMILHGDELGNDIVNYTNIQPVVQINEIILS